ncbi:putative Xaa-Pro aminopeptidase P [Athelia psychrophila]|uniref:Xaa-Pro aminopeptidase P n=1 Tax=Athelia psychrophila TaxID=1759441 RepID=A0A166G4Z5_9AGAM|nr:putative Xaa-Pro aminopeptidase P [Fibularhizoctonia sp. CBS 109695]
MCQSAIWFRKSSSMRNGASALLSLLRSSPSPQNSLFQRYSRNMGTAAAQTVDTSNRIAKLRELMNEKDNSVKAFIVPSEDQHSSEYLAHCDERRAFISGFNGSAGCAIITSDEAYLFTDGRYFLQAEKQLDKNWSLMKQGLPEVPTWQEFLSKKIPEGTRIGIDPTLISAVDAETLKKSLSPLKSELVSLDKNLVDLVWAGDRPARPASQIFPLPTKYSGESAQEKTGRLRQELAKQKAHAMVITMLDEVAWLFNLRGADIEFNPVFFAYAIVTQDSATLFVNPEQIDDEVQSHLGTEFEVVPYNDFFSYLKTFVDKIGLKKDVKVLLGDKASLAVAEAVGQDNVTIVRSPIADLKSIKNQTEIEGFRHSHIRDGAALARYFAWLEEQLETDVEVTEYQGAEKLKEFRSELWFFKGLSFETISSTGPNAAIIHYAPDAVGSAIIKKDQIYLCDSGGQYLDGTTDVTRTLHFGTPTDEEKRAFTRVLQGHIAIDTAIFPTGTTGFDAFARRALWQDGLDYRHGTGHGVGHFLNVHEGPHGIGVRIGYNSTPLKVGMTVSNEPGYYADGRFGIRIESVVIVTEAKTPNNFGDKGYLGFECLTMSPIQKTLIELELLTPQERAWLNAYNAETLQKVSPLVANDLRALGWLNRECSPL